MKHIRLLITAIIWLSFFAPKLSAQVDMPSKPSDTLCILWTSSDPEVALKMVFMYANTAKKQAWFSQVEIIIWGPSSKLTSENSEVQEYIKTMQNNGVKVEACKACADQYGVSSKLEALGIEVKYMGQDLTQILKSNKPLMTF